MPEHFTPQDVIKQFAVQHVHFCRPPAHSHDVQTTQLNSDLESAFCRVVCAAACRRQMCRSDWGEGSVGGGVIH